MDRLADESNRGSDGFCCLQKRDSGLGAKNIWLYCFIALYAMCGFFTVKAWVDILPILAQAVGAIAVWQTSARAIRFLMLVPRPLWFTYNFVVGSQAGVVAEIFITSSVVLGILRFDILPLIPGFREGDPKKFTRWFERRDRE